MRCESYLPTGSPGVQSLDERRARYAPPQLPSCSPPAIGSRNITWSPSWTGVSSRSFSGTRRSLTKTLKYSFGSGPNNSAPTPGSCAATTRRTVPVVAFPVSTTSILLTPAALRSGPANFTTTFIIYIGQGIMCPNADSEKEPGRRSGVLANLVSEVSSNSRRPRRSPARRRCTSMPHRSACSAVGVRKVK